MGKDVHRLRRFSLAICSPLGGWTSSSPIGRSAALGPPTKLHDWTLAAIGRDRSNERLTERSMDPGSKIDGVNVFPRDPAFLGRLILELQEQRHVVHTSSCKVLMNGPDLVSLALTRVRAGPSPPHFQREASSGIEAADSSSSGGGAFATTS